VREQSTVNSGHIPISNNLAALRGLHRSPRNGRPQRHTLTWRPSLSAPCCQQRLVVRRRVLAGVRCASETFITVEVLLSWDYRGASEVGTRLLQATAPDRMCHMCPLPSGQGPLFSASSEQLTHSARPSLNLLQSRASIPPVLVPHIALAGDKCARPASDDSGLELSRLLVNRLKVLVAALQQVKEFQRKAADAPEKLQ
jgi:hypothetical protein